MTKVECQDFMKDKFDKLHNKDEYATINTDTKYMIVKDKIRSIQMMIDSIILMIRICKNGNTQVLLHLTRFFL